MKNKQTEIENRKGDSNDHQGIPREDKKRNVDLMID